MNKNPHCAAVIPLQKSLFLPSALIGLVMCSIPVVTQAADYNRLDKPAYTLKIVTHGEASNRSNNLSEVTRQDNRRADVKIKTRVKIGTRTVVHESTKQPKVGSNQRSVRLKDGGVIWVTKDPVSLSPSLNVTGPARAIVKNGQLVEPINFNIKTNYSHFIKAWKLSIYDSEDEDKQTALATFMGKDLANGRSIKWDGRTKNNKKLKSGTEFNYVLTVRNSSGHSDETRPHKVSLISNVAIVDSQQTKTSTKLANAENDLVRQTIPVNGSRVRIFGRDIHAQNSIAINNESIAVDNGRFFIEKLLPDGQHHFDIAIKDSHNAVYHKPLNVDLSSKYLFMVGLADVTVGEGKATGNMVALSAGDEHYDGDIFVDGRLAFYLKGKIQGKYLVTAQMDTGTDAIENLFDDIHKKDPRSLFRRLDPDKFYPVYGDDSTIVDDTNSQGKMYVRVDWDKSRALWGNYNTDFTGTELSSFNRTLYGAKLNHKSTAVTKQGDHKTDVTVFASESQSAFRHNQFLGTGGSLYYLKDTDIVDGSEKIWIELRQRESDRAVKTIVMEEGRDYEIDDFQGRIILHRPLLQIVKQSGPSLIKDEPLDGDQVYLMVDYEYVPSKFDTDKASYGSRGKAWINDNIAVGGTYVHENRNSKDYELKGADITFKKEEGTYVKAEYAVSESVQTDGGFQSNDGGLNFTPFDDNRAAATNQNGSAFSLEARANLKGLTNREGFAGAWYKKRGAGFSSSRFNDLADTVDTGIEAQIKVTENLDASAKATLVDKENLNENITASAQLDYKANKKTILSAELRYLETDDKTVANRDSKAALGAFKVGYDVNDRVNLFGIAQGTIKKAGAYENNDLFTIGATARVNDKLEVNTEFSSGARGDAATLGANYKFSNTFSTYTNYTLSTDNTSSKRSTFTVGQRKTLSDQLKVYTEHQFTHDNQETGVGHSIGLDYTVNKELTLNSSLQTSRLEKAVGGLTDRDAFSVGLTYKKEKTEASTRLEYRKDKGIAEDTEQWVSTNRVHYRLSPSLRLQGKLNHSVTNDNLGRAKDARFTEAALGFALRPVNNDKLNVLGRLTYLYDLQPLSQSTTPDEKALIASIETSYQLNQKWELGGKLAHKLSEVRQNRNAGAWNKNDATLAAARVRYHLTHKWDAMAEYHWMNSDESKTLEHGAMISVDRHLGKNMKIGIGYNFTNFDDDLRSTTGTAKGWFINLVGKY